MLLSKFLFLVKRPKVVLVVGSAKKTAKEAILKVLSRHLKVGKEIIIFDDDAENFDFLLKKSRLPILVVSHIGEYHPEKEFFAGEIKQLGGIGRLAEELTAQAKLILNFDDETVREIKNQSKAHTLTFGFGLRSDVRVTDIVLTQFPTLGTNFKINHDGNIVPCWLENLFGKENIYAALSAVAAGLALKLNLVEVSQALKTFRGLPGKMQLVQGIRKSFILDDSENASSLSMLESLGILKKIEGSSRKIAVLGDILGIGKYSLEAHETIGAEVKSSADLLFTIGERAKFFAQGAKIKGMPEDKIFQFGDAISAAKTLQGEIKEGDLVLVDGSKEMSMTDIVKEVKLENFS